MMMMRKAFVLLVVAIAFAAGCASRGNGGASSSTASRTPLRGANARPNDADVKAQYPDLNALYAGSAGIYRSCAANQGVCHNDKEYPNLATVGAITRIIGAPCNVTKERARDIHDLCEGKGDLFAIGGDFVEIGSLRELVPPKKEEADEDETEGARAFRGRYRRHIQRYRVKLRRDPVVQGYDRRARLMRDLGGGKKRTLGVFERLGRPKGATDGRTLDLIPSNGATYGEDWEKDEKEEETDEDDELQPTGFAILDGENVNPNVPVLRMGDPNENGIYGAEIGGGLVVPGKPEKSYLLRRLSDPSAGPLMPRANCCAWSKASLRALQCWIANLAPDGKNALAPIDYTKCPAEGLAEDIEYPERGASCEGSGMCPVRPRAMEANGATWSAVYRTVLSQRCGGEGSCHMEQKSGALDLRPSAAYQSVMERVAPYAPARSELYVRLTPELCKAPECSPMPLGGKPVDAQSRDLVKRWIERGAPED